MNFFCLSLRPWKWILALLCMVACVTQQPPEGGPPDETPLQLTHTMPKQEATNFQEKKLRFTFNKPIATAGNLLTNAVIMPTLAQSKNKNKQAYSYTISGHTLTIFLKVPLKKETTYTFNINNAIKDTHEGLQAANATLTFSTGPFIDPITVKGRVKELLTNHAVGDVNIYLYHSDRDPKTWQKADQEQTPDYYTTSDKEGNFTIEHIRLGNYYIRATTGKNNKFKIDYEKDRYGFLQAPIDLNDAQSNLVIPLIAADVRDLKLLYVKPMQQGVCEITFNKAIAKYHLTALQSIGTRGKPQLYTFHSEESPKSIFVYNTFGLLEGESFMVRLMAEDASDMKLEQDVEIGFKRGKADKTTDLTHRLSKRALSSVLPAFKETISFNKPIQTFNQTFIYFSCKNKEKIPLKEHELSWNSDISVLTIEKTFSAEEIEQLETSKEQDKNKAPKKMVILQIEPGACTAYDKEKNKSISVSYPLRDWEETGTISGHIDTATAHFIIELLNESADTIIDRIRDKKDYCFTMVPSGNYKVRIRLLHEGAETWSPGNIRQNVEPNPVIFYEGVISLVEKWDLKGIDFKF